MTSTVLPELILFVKAGADGKRYGACPFCQRIFMILILKAKDDKVVFRVATVNLAKPPEEFKKLSLRRVPAISHGDESIDNMDDIVDYLDTTFVATSLIYENVHSVQACKDVFQKFCFYIKEVSKDSSHLIAELAKLDAFLKQSKWSYLCGDELKNLDCEILPKLHHVRVASKYLKGFDIDVNLKGLWSYLKQAYNNPAFLKSCPSDQEIILHWADKPETPNLTMEQHSHLTKESPTYLTTVPEET